MSSYFEGGRSHVIVELPNGAVYELDASATNIELRNEPFGGTSVSMSFEGSNLEFATRETFLNDIKNRRSMAEYRCDYCQSPYPPSNTHCSRCGAPRSFLLEG